MSTCTDRLHRKFSTDALIIHRRTNKEWRRPRGVERRRVRMSAPPKGKSVLQCGRPQQLARRSGVDISRVDEGRAANGEGPANRDANLAGWAGDLLQSAHQRSAQ